MVYPNCISLEPLFIYRTNFFKLHPQIYLTNVWCFEEYLQAFKMFLTLPKSFSKRSSGKQSFCKLWNNYVDELLKSPSVLKSLQMQFDVCKEISPLCKLLALPLAHFNPLRDVSEYTGMIVKAVTSAHADSKVPKVYQISGFHSNSKFCWYFYSHKCYMVCQYSKFAWLYLCTMYRTHTMWNSSHFK